MKKIVSVILICITALSLSLNVSAETEVPSYYPDSERGIVSGDNNYLYATLDDGSGICFEGTNIKNLTVLNIPATIDGKTVTGIFSTVTDSKSLVKINFSDTIETVYKSIFVYSRYEDAVPICTVAPNRSLKQINTFGFDVALSWDYTNYEQNISLKHLIFPSETITVKNYAVFRDITDSIVFEGVPVLEGSSFTVQSEGVGKEGPEYTPCDVYFAGSPDNAAADTFNFLTPITDDVLGTGSEYLPCPGVTIYKKPGADGFEKFEDEGYSVKEYTDEWWKTIKEIESVEITGKGIIETKNSDAKGTIKNLGWSASNDPLQYLSHEYSLQMNKGEKVKLSSTFAPSDAFDDRMFFVSLNEDVVKVDVDSGEITAIKKGAATVRCVAASGVFSDVVITVGKPTAASSQTAAENKTQGTSAAPENNISANSTETDDKTTAPADSGKKTVKPVYIAVPSAAAVIAVAATVIIKKKKRA